MLKSSDLNERWAEKIAEINYVLDWEVAIKYETKNCYNLMVRSPRLMQKPQSRSENSTNFVLMSSRGRKRIQLTLFWQQNEQNCHCGT